MIKNNEPCDPVCELMTGPPQLKLFGFLFPQKLRYALFNIAECYITKYNLFVQTYMVLYSPIGIYTCYWVPFLLLYV